MTYKCHRGNVTVGIWSLPPNLWSCVHSAERQRLEGCYQLNPRRQGTDTGCECGIREPHISIPPSHPICKAAR